MAVFKYRLQNVLDIKMRFEDQAKSEFSAASAKLDEEERKLEELLDRKAMYEEEGRRIREDVLDMQDLRDNTRALDKIKEMIVGQENRVAAAKEALERARGRLTDAVQERKIHEKLKENSFEEFVHEVNAAESKEIDELVSYTYGERIKKEESNDG